MDTSDNGPTGHFLFYLAHFLVFKRFLLELSENLGFYIRKVLFQGSLSSLCDNQLHEQVI